MGGNKIVGKNKYMIIRLKKELLESLLFDSRHINTFSIK